MFIQCDITKLTDVEVVNELSSYLKEYTYRKSPEGFIVEYCEEEVLKPMPFHEINTFRYPSDNIPIDESHDVNGVYFIHMLNRKSNLSPFHMRFSSGHIIYTTVMNKKSSVKNHTNSEVHVRTYIFHYSERELRKCMRRNNVDVIEMYCYHYYSVIGRVVEEDEHRYFQKCGCQIVVILVVENEEFNGLLKAVQMIKKFNSKPYLLPEYRLFNTPLVFYLFQEYEGDSFKLVKHGERYSSFIMDRSKIDLSKSSNEYKPVQFKIRTRHPQLRTTSHLQIFHSDIVANKIIFDEITKEIKILRDSEEYRNMMVEAGELETTHWLCKLEIGKMMFWFTKHYDRHLKTCEVGIQEMKSTRIDLTPFYSCELNRSIHNYVRSLVGKKLRKIGEKRDFPVTVIDCTEGKEFTLNFLIGQDNLLEFDKSFDQTLFTRIYVTHTYSFDLDYEIFFYKHNESKEVNGGIDWIVSLFHGKNVKEIDELILLTNDRYIFYYDTNLENTKIEKFLHERSGFEIEIKEEKKIEVVGEKDETIEYTTYITPPKFEMLEKPVDLVLKNLTRFTNELLKKGTLLEAKRRKMRKKKKKKSGTRQQI